MRKTVSIFAILLVCIFQSSFGLEETITFKDAFTVRKVQGIVKSAVGMWPNNFASDGIVFMLYGPENSDKIWKIKLDNNGKFNRKVPQGRYKLRLKFMVGTMLKAPSSLLRKQRKKQK